MAEVGDSLGLARPGRALSGLSEKALLSGPALAKDAWRCRLVDPAMRD